MSVARHHAEWLSLVETSGPFLSMPVLLRVFPQGLDQRDPVKASRLREAYEDWLERGCKQPAVHHAWIRHVLAELLEYPPEFLMEGQGIPPGNEAVIANYGETLRPDFVLSGRSSPSPPAAGGEGQGEVGSPAKPLLLIEHYPPDQDLEKPVAGKTWKASPGTRMMELLHVADVPLGLITNGEQWMLVSAPRGETSGFASWYADLWMQEPLTLRAFHSLLHLRRFLGVAEPETLAALYAESSKDQQEVTAQLGYQVRQAVEMLVQAFDRIDAESGRKLLADVSEKALYDSALTVMMRLVFLFSADERGLLLLGDPLYDQHYSVSTLSELLRERADQHGEEVLERRHDGWCRLLATFRAVHAGVQHEAMRLPPYGGTLFDPDRYPFLEGRVAGTHWQTTAANPLPINNRVVLHLLEALQVLRVKVPGGGPAEARRLSFRALDIEQIGHVYEGLLDHTAKRAQETILGLQGTRDQEPEILLSKLEELAGASSTRIEDGPETAEPDLLAAESAATVAPLPCGRQAASYEPAPVLIEFLREHTGRTEKALRKALLDQSKVDENRLLIACGHERRLFDRIWRFAALLRPDTFGFPTIIPVGSVYVTSGSDRRSTGTHYTPRSLTEPIVQHTLEPLVYAGPAEGKPKAEWKLKSPREILALKVCDMTMGSGAFLVQTCRYLGERLVEAWENAERAANSSPSPPSGVSNSQSAIRNLKFIKTPEGDLSTGDSAERLLPADPAERLAIARRYVADRCVYGVDINPMAVEMAKLSLWLITLQRDRPFTFLDHALKCGDSLLGVSSVQQIENFSLRPGDRQVTFATANLFRYVDEASAKRRALEDLPSNEHTQIETKNRLHAEAEAATVKVKALADALIAFELRGLYRDAYEEQRAAEAEKLQLLMKRDADASLNSQTPTINQLSAYAREQLNGRRLFHWAVEFPEVFARGGFNAYVGNPPFLGGSRITGVQGTPFRDFLVRHVAGGVAGKVDLSTYFFLRAFDSLRAAGSFGLLATNSIAQGDARVAGLEQILQRGGHIFRAIPNQQWPGVASVEVAVIWIHKGAWQGEQVLGLKSVSGISSYLFEQNEAKADPERLAASANLVFRGTEVRGEGFILEPDTAAQLLAIRTLNQQVIFPYLSGEDLNTRPDQSPSRWIINFHDWDRTRASQHPECLAILTEKVKPYRDTITKQVHESDYWKFWDKRLAEYARIATMPRVLATAKVSPTNAVAWVKPGIVFHEKVVIFPLKESWAFAVMQSSFHWEWVRFYTSTLGATTLNYSPTDCFETFPFPGPSPLIISSSAADRLNNVSEIFYSERSRIMIARHIGLTKTYNRFHDRGEQSADIARLRALHVEMDRAVAAAYGWSDLDLGHGFHATKQGERYTISEPARRTVLDRLLALNHQRYAEEVKAGQHGKGAKKSEKRKAKSMAAPSGELPPNPQPDLLG